MPIIQGQVVDPEGHPLAEAAVYFVAAPVTMPDVAQLTNGDGKFSAYVGAPGHYTLGVRSDEWGEARKDVNVIGEDPVTIEVRFDKLEGEEQ